MVKVFLKHLSDVSMSCNLMIYYSHLYLRDNFPELKIGIKHELYDPSIFIYLQLMSLCFQNWLFYSLQSG